MSIQPLTTNSINHHQQRQVNTKNTTTVSLFKQPDLMNQLHFNICQQNKTQVEKSHGAKNIAGITFGAAIAFAATFMVLKSRNVKSVSSVIRDNISNLGEYRENLAKGLSEYLGKKVESKKLSCVLNKDEFIDIISKLKKENYICTKENMEKGIFMADLHSHSNFSDGKGKVEELLDAAAKYGDDLFSKTKNKFIFALTDHDGVDGVKKALEIISENPDKYKNINFVAGSELSFALKSPKSANPTETSEILAYCINPFKKNITSYFDALHRKRRNTIIQSINELDQMFPNAKFSPDEFAKTYNANLNNGMFQMNLHWRLHHYGQTKLAISDIAQNSGKNANALYSDIMSNARGGKALGNLKDDNLIPYHIEENPEIIALKERIQPRIDLNGLVKAKTESTIEEIANAFSEDKDTIFALAHPYYLTERMENPAEYAKSILGKLNGKLIGTESYHQAYSNKISTDEINRVNSNLEKLNLIPLGGRDNHNPMLF